MAITKSPENKMESKMMEQAIKDERPSGIHYAEKRIKECLEDAVKHAQA